LAKLFKHSGLTLHILTSYSGFLFKAYCSEVWKPGNSFTSSE